MKSIQNWLAALILGLGSLSCSATGPSFSEVEASLPPIPEGMGRVFFYYALTGVTASNVFDLGVALDNKELRELELKGFYFVDREVGEHIAAVDPVGAGGRLFVGVFDPGSLWKLPKNLRVKFEIKEGKETFIACRFRKKGSKHFITENNPEQGYTDLLTCVYIGSMSRLQAAATEGK